MLWTETIGHRDMVKANWTALPTVILAASFAGGEIAGFASPCFAGLWAWVSLLVVLIVCMSVGWGVPCGKFFVAFMVGVALAWRSEADRISAEEFSQAFQPGGGAPVFTLKVEGEASCRTGKRGSAVVRFNSWVKNIPVTVVAPASKDKPVPKDGEWWRCSGWLTLRKNSASRYSRRMLWVTKGGVFEKTGDSSHWSAGSLYRRLSCELAHRMGQGLGWSPELASFGKAMLLGKRNGMPYGRLAVFAAAGTIHVFAISGLHVMLMAGMLAALLKTLGLGAKMVSVVAIPILWAYVMLIGAPASAVRAALMTSLYLAAHLFGRRPDSLAAWSVAVIAVSGVSPKMILNVGCVLSFVVMLGIILWIRWSAQFASPVDRLLKIAAVEDALGCVRRKRIALWIHRWATWVLGALGISLAAWIAGAPIAARVFERLSFGSVMINVVIVPLAGMSVGFAVFGIIASFVLPQLTALFNNLSAFGIYLMQWLSEMVVNIPGSHVDTLPWGWCDCAMWYVAWFLVFALLSRYLPRRERFAVKEWEHGDD